MWCCSTFGLIGLIRTIDHINLAGMDIVYITAAFAPSDFTTEAIKKWAEQNNLLDTFIALEEAAEKSRKAKEALSEYFILHCIWCFNISILVRCKL